MIDSDVKLNRRRDLITMAKKDKAAKAEAAETEKTSAPEFKFGVADLAEELGIEPASVRVQLRNRKIEKAGKSYGWNSKSELKEVVEQLKAKPAGEGRRSKKADADEAPAKGKKGKKGKKSDD